MTEKRDPAAPALDPRGSIVIEACAGSGKTWMLVSRIVRLLLAGAAPSQILAITFTRKAAQEMATRLRDWLYELATESDDHVRQFLRERFVPEGEIEALLPVARQLYERFLTAQPSITITTFHSWFLQLLRRAPLDAGALGEVNLAEQTSALMDEAWQLFASRLQREADSPARRGLEQLFRDCGLDNTRRLLTRFLYHRAEWWAYVRGERDPAAHALARMRGELGVDPDADVPSALFADAGFAQEIGEYTVYLERNTSSDQERAGELSTAQPDPQRLFAAACRVVMTDNGAGNARARKASDAQAKRLTPRGEARFLELHAKLAARLAEARGHLIDQRSYRFNEAALHCGVALLDAYQRVKADRQVIDYADIEWNAWQLVLVSDHALYMHYKLDARYRHILLDEFQDTNPLQWLTLKSWLEAAAAADLRPTVFMVGDPKQSIYRFRRAEARLFTQAADYLQAEFQAARQPQDETRRCPPPVVDVVNRLFSREGAFERYETHVAHYAGKPGCVEVLPLIAASAASQAASADRVLRNPLTERLEVEEDRRREDEARQLVDGIRAIQGRWQVSDDPKGEPARPAEYRDIMILVRRRTHLAIYERALRHAGVPFVTSRQGGLLDTLEARDIVALLEFLVSPFADLQLAHALRAPVFACSDEDLMALARAGEGRTWWERLQRVAAGECSPALRRAHELLARWLQRTDSAPVHDQLDRIYFEADVLHRYDQSVPKAMRETVRANLQAIMQRALDVDSGRYPSLPRFLHELMDLREAPPEEAPDEGIVGDAGNAVRIYTVHGAKGLEAPIVWLLDSAAGQEAGRGYDALIDWPPEAHAPQRFSLYARAKEQSAAQRTVADAEESLAERENLNMLYVAMTRAQQALIVSGCEGRGRAGSWYEKVRGAVRAAAGHDTDDATAVARVGADLAATAGAGKPEPEPAAAATPDPRLRIPLPTGERRQLPSGRGLEYGVRFHALIERLTAAAPANREAIERDLGLPGGEFTAMWEQAQRVMSAHARFFDARQFRRAVNEISYISATGEVRRIDRLVEREDAVWVLDYKTGEPKADAALLAQYRAQLAEYRDAMRLAYGSARPVNGAILFADGTAITLED